MGENGRESMQINFDFNFKHNVTVELNLCDVRSRRIWESATIPVAKMR